MPQFPHLCNGNNKNNMPSMGVVSLKWIGTCTAHATVLIKTKKSPVTIGYY